MNEGRKFSPILQIVAETDKWHDAREVSKLILVMLAAGVIVSTTLVAPAAPRFLIPILQFVIDRPWKRYRILLRLKRQRFVKAVRQSDGSVRLVLTRHGQQAAERISLQYVKLRRPPRWDKHWRVLIFDIPEQKRELRSILREKIKQLDFRQIQKSVWLLPWPCEQEISFIRDIFGLERYLLFWKVPDSQEFDRYRSLFDL